MAFREREWRKVATLNVAGKLQFSMNVPLSSFWATKVENIIQKEKCEKLVCFPFKYKRGEYHRYIHTTNEGVKFPVKLRSRLSTATKKTEIVKCIHIKSDQIQNCYSSHIHSRMIKSGFYVWVSMGWIVAVGIKLLLTVISACTSNWIYAIIVVITLWYQWFYTDKPNNPLVYSSVSCMYRCYGHRHIHLYM